MAKDAGARAPAVSEPAGVVTNSGIEIRIADPLDEGVGYVYLFVQTGSLDPGAGQQYVTYTFNPLSGNYKETYNAAGGDWGGPQVNPEDSFAGTAYYSQHWSWRWTCDETSILVGTGVDIIERRDFWFTPGVCERHNGTFNAGEGAFVVNKSGPVRALRSYLGANSAPLTQVVHKYYERREDQTTYLRCHPLSAVGSIYTDYSLDAFGMLYLNNNNLTGVVIDGSPDPVTAGSVMWEMVTGSQGSLVTLHDLITDIPYEPEEITSFYEDDLNTSLEQCTADGGSEIINDDYMIGASGPWNQAPLPDTDPIGGSSNFLSVYTTRYFDPPGLTQDDAERRLAWKSNPLLTSSEAWGSGELTRIEMLSPANESILFSAPTFTWTADGGANNRYAVDFSLSFPITTYWSTHDNMRQPISEGVWIMRDNMWSFIPPGSYVYWRVRGADVDVRPLTVLPSDTVWWFYKP
jgi:hypothetical protein